MAEPNSFYQWVKENIPYTHVTQLPLPNIFESTEPEFQLTGLPTRTLASVLNEDLVRTLMLIREKYLPLGLHEELEMMQEAVDWVKDNKTEFMKTGTNSGDMDDLYVSVLVNYHTLRWVCELQNNVGFNNNKEQRVPVAFSPYNPDFKIDVKQQTFAQYQHIRKEGLAMNKAANFLEHNSTSRTLYLMTRLFWGGEDDDFALEAADMLTKELFTSYYFGLKSRFQISEKYYL